MELTAAVNMNYIIIIIIGGYNIEFGHGQCTNLYLSVIRAFYVYSSYDESNIFYTAIGKHCISDGIRRESCKI